MKPSASSKKKPAKKKTKATKKPTAKKAAKATAKKPAKATAKTTAKKATQPAKKAAKKAPKKAAKKPPEAAALLVAMTGRASAAKAALGDEPVFRYIQSLPQPQRGVAERVDALASQTLPSLQRCIKWGIAWYGVGDGWCFSCGAFVGHVKLTFGRGTSLQPVPPMTPVGMGKDSRGVDLASIDDLDERQLSAWMKQAAALPGFGKR